MAAVDSRRLVETVFPILVAGACTYEVVAILTRRVPTISELQRRYPIIRYVIDDGLDFHFSAPGTV